MSMCILCVCVCGCPCYCHFMCISMCRKELLLWVDCKIKNSSRVLMWGHASVGLKIARCSGEESLSIEHDPTTERGEANKGPARPSFTVWARCSLDPQLYFPTASELKCKPRRTSVSLQLNLATGATSPNNLMNSRAEIDALAKQPLA